MTDQHKPLQWHSRQEAARIKRENALHTTAMRHMERAVGLDRSAMVRFALDVIACNPVGALPPEEADIDTPRVLFDLVPADDSRAPVPLVGVLSDENLLCDTCGRSNALAIYDVIDPAVPSWMELEIHWCSHGHGHLTPLLKNHRLREARS